MNNEEACPIKQLMNNEGGVSRGKTLPGSPLWLLLLLLRAE